MAAPRPTNISTKAEPAIWKKVTPASPATALASSVLPVPGGPTSSAPRGQRAPISLYFSGFLRKLTISSSDSLASSWPATSLNVTPVSSPLISLALDLPRPPPMPKPPPPKFMEGPSSPIAFFMRRLSHQPMPRNSRIGRP